MTSVTRVTRANFHVFYMAASLLLLLMVACSSDPTQAVPGAGRDADTAAVETAAQERLSWSPPVLSNPRTVYVAANSSQNIIKLASNTDYRIELPNTPVTRGLALSGGRNVVLIGGEIAIPWQGANASIASRTGLKIKGATGTVHIEGLLIRGSDVSEGVQIDAPNAVVQLENVGIFNIRARDQVGFSDNHPDLIQTYGNVRELRVDRFTGSTDYQGLFLSANYNGPHGPVRLKRVNVVGNRTARNLLWIQPQRSAGAVSLEHVYLDAGGMANRTLSEAVWPNGRGSYPNEAQLTTYRSRQSVTWPEAMTPFVEGFATVGRPPQGDFVSPNAIGVGYCPGTYELDPAATEMASARD